MTPRLSDDGGGVRDVHRAAGGSSDRHTSDRGRPVEHHERARGLGRRRERPVRQPEEPEPLGAASGPSMGHHDHRARALTLEPQRPDRSAVHRNQALGRPGSRPQALAPRPAHTLGHALRPPSHAGDKTGGD